MNFRHLISYLFFSISLFLMGLLIHKHFKTENKYVNQKLILEVEKQRCKLKKMSDDVINMTHDLKHKKIDTFEIIKNKEKIVVKVQENEIVIKDTIIQYLTLTDTVTEYLTSTDTIYIQNEIKETLTTEKKKRFFKKN